MAKSYRNFYRCTDCGEQWDDEWDSMCDDECPSCQRAFTPYRSEGLGEGEDAECQGCGERWDEDQLLPVQDLFARVAPGEPMPMGECPGCGALCHMIEMTIGMAYFAEFYDGWRSRHGYPAREAVVSVHVHDPKFAAVIQLTTVTSTTDWWPHTPPASTPSL